MKSKPTPTWFLREWRLKRGLTLEELAERTNTNMSRSDVSKLELGKRRWNEDQLWEFAHALDVEAWWIVSVNPNDPNSDLEVLESLRRVPAGKRGDAVRILGALQEEPDGSFDPEPPARPPSRKRPS